MWKACRTCARAYVENDFFFKFFTNKSLWVPFQSTMSRRSITGYRNNLIFFVWESWRLEQTWVRTCSMHVWWRLFNIFCGKNVLISIKHFVNIQQMCKRVATLSTINTQINFQKNSYLKLTSRIERGHLKTKTTAHKRKYCLLLHNTTRLYLTLRTYIWGNGTLFKTNRTLEKYLKGLGHAILGNFSIDQMVIELTEITK